MGKVGRYATPCETKPCVTAKSQAGAAVSTAFCSRRGYQISATRSSPSTAKSGARVIVPRTVSRGVPRVV